MGTANQLRAASSLTSVKVAGVDLPVADDIKVLGVLLDRRLTFDKHVSAVAWSCNYHAQAIRHIRHLLTMDLAQTLARSLILSRIDYCNAVLHGAPYGTIHKLQRVQNNATRIVHQASRRSHTRIHCWRNYTGCRWSSASLTSWPCVQNATDASTNVPQSTHHSTQWNSVTEIIGCSTAPCALQTDCHRQTIVQLRWTDNLELYLFLSLTVTLSV